MQLVSSNIPDIDSWCHETIILNKSNIHGTGVFSTSRIMEGETLFRLGGTVFTKSERRSNLVIRSTCTALSENTILAEPISGKKDYSDFINHSCNPNIGMVDALTLVAISNIEPYHEILIDYSFWESDKDWQLKADCNCGSINCRGHISGNDWMQITMKHHHFPHFAPFLKRRILNNSTNHEPS